MKTCTYGEGVLLSSQRRKMLVAAPFNHDQGWATRRILSMPAIRCQLAWRGGLFASALALGLPSLVRITASCCANFSQRQLALRSFRHFQHSPKNPVVHLILIFIPLVKLILPFSVQAPSPAAHPQHVVSWEVAWKPTPRSRASDTPPWDGPHARLWKRTRA